MADTAGEKVPSGQRAVLVVPDHAWPEGGNAVTATRIAGALKAGGFPAEVTTASDLKELGKQPGIALLHGMHLRRSGIPAARLAAKVGCSLVLTVTGTDLHQDALDGALWQQVAGVLRQADAVTVFHEEAARTLRASAKGLPRLEVVPPGVAVLPGAPDRAAFGLPDDAFVFLLPAGLRPVKDPLFALGPLGRLRSEGHPVLLVLAGPDLDATCRREVEEACAAAGWLRWLGPVPHRQMGSLYRSVDAVLNTSISEGLSNAVLEAMACGRPVLARKNPGNVAALADVGGLFVSAEQLLGLARRLVVDTPFGERLGAAGARRAADAFSPESEARAYAALYRDLTCGPVWGTP